MFQSRTSATAALAGLAVAWGTIPLIVREEVPAMQLVAARLWLGAAALLVGLGLIRQLRWPEVDRWRIVVSGVLLAVHWSSFFLALKATTVAIALALVYLGPVIAAVAARPLLGERPSRLASGGLALGAIGVFLVLRPGAGATVDGVLWGAVAAVTFAAIMIIAKPATQTVGPLLVAAGELVVASLLLTPWAVVAVRDSAGFWPQFLVLGVLLTGVASLIFWSAMRVMDVAAVGVMLYLEPASAVIWAVLVLGESPPPISWMGIVLVIAGGVLAARETAGDVAAPVPSGM